MRYVILDDIEQRYQSPGHAADQHKGSCMRQMPHDLLVDRHPRNCSHQREYGQQQTRWSRLMLPQAVVEHTASSFGNAFQQQEEKQMRLQGEHNGAGSQSQRPQRVLPRSQTKFSIDPGMKGIDWMPSSRRMFELKKKPAYTRILRRRP